MKKIISLIAVCAATTSAYAAPQLVRRSDNAYNVTYDYTDKAKSGFYLTGRVGLSLLNFKNTYSSNYPGAVDDHNSDTYSFKSVLELGGSFGYRFTPHFRGDIEGGYIGNFSDKDDGFEYILSIPYAMFNGYYDFSNGLYVGIGAGMAFPTMKLDGPYSDSGNRSKTSVGFMGGLSFGYVLKLDDNIALDLRYRISGITGVKHSRQFVADDSNTYDLTTETGFIMDNSISLGIRYEF